MYLKISTLVFLLTFTNSLQTSSAACDGIRDLLAYFNDDIPDLKLDYSKLKWSPTVKSMEDLENAFKTDVHMIKINVIDKNEMAFIEQEEEDVQNLIPLQTFLKNYKRSDGKRLPGLKMFIKTQVAYDSALIIFKNIQNEIESFPIVLDVNVAVGPGGTDQNLIDLHYKDNPQIHCFAISLGFTTGLNPALSYTRKMLDALNEFPFIPKMYSIRGVYLEKSWTNIESTTSHNIPFIFWLEQGDEVHVDLLHFRNMLKKRRRSAFVDLPQAVIEDVKALCPEHQDVYEFFKGSIDGLADDLKKLKWFGTVTAREELDQALKKTDIHMIKADVVESEGIALIGSDPNAATFTLEEFLEASKGKRKGVKLHFRSTEALEVTINNNAGAIKDLDYPLWIEADVLKGPGGSDDLVELNYEANEKFLSCHTLSLGWTTSGDDPSREYSRNMTKDMQKYVTPNSPVITFSIRAIYYGNSERYIDAYLMDDFNYVLVWTTEEDEDQIVTMDIRNTDLFYSYVYMDIPQSMDYIFDECPKNRNIFRYLNIPSLSNDLTQVIFSDYVRSPADFDRALDGEAHMVTAEVFEGKGIDGGRIPVVSKDGETMFSLKDLLDSFETCEATKGLMLSFKSTEAFRLAMKEHSGKLRVIEKPIWVRADVAKGPGGTAAAIIDIDYIANNHVLDCCQLVLGWTTGIGEEKTYEEEHIAAMQEVERGRSEKIYAVRTEYYFNNVDVYKDYEFLLAYTLEEGMDTFNVKEFRRELRWWRRSIFVHMPHHLLLDCPRNQDTYEYFGITSMNRWQLKFHDSDLLTLEDVNGALNDEFGHMLKADVYESDGDAVIGAVDGNPKLTLGELLEALEPAEGKKGIVLNMQSTEAFAAAMRLYSPKLKTITRPIWIRAAVLQGPGGTTETVNLNYASNNDILDCRNLLLAWTTTNEGPKLYTKDQIIAMRDIEVQGLSKIYEVRGEFLAGSWHIFSEILPPGENRYVARVPKEGGDVVVSKYLRPIVKNHTTTFYIDVPKEMDYIWKDCPWLQDVSWYFLDLRDELKTNLTILRFHKAVRTLGEFEWAFKSDKHMISADVYEYEGRAVIGDGPQGTSPFTLTQFLETLEKNGKGIQLRFKTTSAFTAAAEHDYNNLRNINCPIWINANILKGPGGDDEGVVHLDYDKYNDLLDCRSMVLGWTTDNTSTGVYTEEHVTAMKAAHLGDSAKIYSIRAILATGSDFIDDLLEDENYLLTWALESDKDVMIRTEMHDFVRAYQNVSFLDFSEIESFINGASINNVSFSIILVILLYIFVNH